jgi:hypothetical protein
MNFKKITLSTIFCALLFISFSSFAQKKDLRYEVGTSAAISSKSTLPFWLISNKNGIIPNENSSVSHMGLFSEFNKNQNFDFRYGANLVGSIGNRSKAIIDQAFISLRYKPLQLDLGAKHEDTKFDGISSTNGNIFLSNNSRSIPKLSIGFHKFVPIPYLEDWVSIKGMYSEGIMYDDRYVDKTRLHNKNIYFKFGGSRKLNLTVGFQHFAMWGGTSHDDNYGKLPSDLNNYANMLFGKGGTDKSNFFEYVNSVGNHLGGWDIHLNLKTKKVDFELYRQTMFEDHSGIYITRPDGVTGIYAKIKGENRWVSSILYENYYTKFQSGSSPGGQPKEPIVDGELPGKGGYFTGQDNFFNNGIYKSGWTFQKRTIGLPFFYPSFDKNGLAMGTYNNRIVGHHLGISGFFFNTIPYRTKLSYTQNWGTYSMKFPEGMREQFSGLLEVDLPINKLPFNISFAMAIDKGEMLQDNLGCFLKISKTGIFN